MRLLLLLLNLVVLSSSLPPILHRIKRSEDVLDLNSTYILRAEVQAPTNISISKRRGGPPQEARRSNFRIVERYPRGSTGEIPTLTLKPGVRFNINCSTTEIWHSCLWKTPLSEEPCAMFKSSQVQSCGLGDLQILNEQVGSLHVCTLTGTVASTQQFQGSWNCDLTSLPIHEEGDTYDDDQQYFQMKTIKPPRVQFSYKGGRSREPELFETEALELSCSGEDGYPAPTLAWFLNSQQIQFPHPSFRPLHTDGPREQGQGSFSVSETVMYTAVLSDTGKTVSCRAQQRDDENNLSEVYDERTNVHLFIKPIPAPSPAVVTAEMITGIVLLIVALLLVLALVGFAFYTKRWCFSTPIITVSAVKNKETGEMIIQTDEQNKITSGMGTETEPLLGKAFETQTDLGDIPLQLKGKVDNKPNFAIDQTLEFSYEGTGSLAGSLSSLDSEQSSVDLEAEFRALGLPFNKLADMFSQDNDELSGGEVEV